MLDLASLKKIGDKATLKKLVKLLDEMEEQPRTGTGQVKQLKHDLSGYWSRRLNDVDRIVYEIDDENRVIHVISSKNHYKK